MANIGYGRVQRLLARHRKEGRCMHRDRNVNLCNRKQVTGQDHARKHYCAFHAHEFARAHRPLVGLARVWQEITFTTVTHVGPYVG